MTSANVTQYIIYEKATGEKVGTHYQSHLCKTKWGDLLRFQPSEDYEILAWWEDEEEEYHEGKKTNLYDFLVKTKTI